MFNLVLHFLFHFGILVLNVVVMFTLPSWIYRGVSLVAALIVFTDWKGVSAYWRDAALSWCLACLLIIFCAVVL